MSECLSPTEQQAAAALRETFQVRPSEARIGALLLSGMSDEEIAEHAGMKISTVKSHIKWLYRFTGAKSRAQFVNHAMREIAGIDVTHAIAAAWRQKERGQCPKTSSMTASR